MKIKVFSLANKALTPWDFAETKLGKLSPSTLTQALRVYQSNSHQKTSATKTRGEVEGSTKKIYRQKGTGNARHGARYAPLFVGGGIAHGPRALRAGNLKLPKAMRRRALASAILVKLQENAILGIKGVQGVSGKTSDGAKFLTQVTSYPKHKVLILTKNNATLLHQMTRSLQGVTLKRASVANAYDLIAHDTILLTKPALSDLITRTQKPSAGDSHD